jgi:hypothetical protein
MDGISEIAPFIGHGGVVALALLVWWEVRAYRKEFGRELAAHLKEENESRLAFVKAIAVIDRLASRFDAEDAAKKSAAAATAAAAIVAEQIRNEISGVHDTPEEGITPPSGIKKRPRSNPGGSP